MANLRTSKKKRLSSRQTFLLKYVAPGLLLLSFLFMIYINWNSNFAPMAILAMYIAISIFIGFYLLLFRSLKNVWMDDQFLYVSNFREDLKIPLTHVERLTEMKIFNPRRITIHLKQSSHFGKKIVFLGYHEQWLLFGTHPVVKLIQKKINK